MDFLALFDIDNTLLKNLTAHKKSFFEGLRKIYSIQADVESINPHGMTDQQIITEVLKKHEIKEKRNALNFKECMNTIVETFAKEIKNENPVILNGVTHLLEELFRRKIIMGIVSGNLEPIAKLKLEKAGLISYFPVGGYGSDHINRSRLVKLAILRAEIYSGRKFFGNVFIFGDTPRDIGAGKSAGVKTVGIATGKYSSEDLHSAGADFVFTDMSDTGAILTIFN